QTRGSPRKTGMISRGLRGARGAPDGWREGGRPVTITGTDGASCSRRPGPQAPGRWSACKAPRRENPDVGYRPDALSSRGFMRCLPVLAALLCSTAWPGEAPAQVHDDIPLPLTRQALAAAASSIAGVVTDEDGEGISGAAVLAMGSVVTAARTDVRGRFHLSVPPGRYILRATRDGYISTYREAVQVRTDVPLTRNITLLKTDGPDIVLASMAQPVAIGASDADIETSPVESADEPSETVWRLRHLPRTVLRDNASIWDEHPATSPRADLGRNAWVGPLTAGDLYGHVDFLTTSALTTSGEPTTADWPRGVAYVVVGAPVGGHGDWTVRASLAGGPTAAWTFTGEYASNPYD